MPLATQQPVGVITLRFYLNVMTPTTQTINIKNYCKWDPMIRHCKKFINFVYAHVF